MVNINITTHLLWFVLVSWMLNVSSVMSCTFFGSYSLIYDSLPIIMMFRKSESLFVEFIMCYINSRCSLLLFHSSFGINFTDAPQKENPLSKWILMLILTTFASSQMITRWSLLTKIHSWSITSSFQVVKTYRNMNCFTLAWGSLWIIALLCVMTMTSL